jgi:small multidrug resistance family-3 protein
MPLAAMLKSAVLFVAAGLCEIGGGYLVWQWWRGGASWLAGLAGAALLVGYGCATLGQARA